MKVSIKKAIVTEWYEDGKTKEYAVRYDADKTMLQNAREILREIKSDDYFKTLKLDSTQPEIEEGKYLFFATSSKGYDISADICFFE